MTNSKEYNKKWYQEKGRYWHREYYIKNKERLNAEGQAYRKANKEKISEKAKQYCQEHKLQIRIQIKKWLKTENARALIKRQYAIRRTNAKDFEKNTIQRVYEDNIKKYGTLTCYLCLEPILFGNDQLDHKIPISRGGTHEYHNLGIVHAKCNKEKFTKTEAEFVNYKSCNTV
jgi:5-methylcytosine-specific restriction endonuclease McrA